MNDEKRLIRRFNAGETEALRVIYERYRSDLFAVAQALLFDPAGIEDVLHDVFVQFAAQAGRFRLKGSLKGYLAICVANRARNANRSRNAGLVARERCTDFERKTEISPSGTMEQREQQQALVTAMQQLPDTQREVVALHVLAALRFREIARQTQTSVHTTQSRYRYGLQKLRTLLNGELEP